jgi:hypothetical protein
MMIAAGSGAQTSVELPAGKYLFEAYLPNGDVATRTATVKEGANEPVWLRGQDSPREWLSWQHLAGMAPVRAAGGGADAAAAPVRFEVVTGGSAGPLPAALLAVWKGAPAGSLGWVVLDVPPRPGSAVPMVDLGLGVSAYLYERGPWQDGNRYYGLARPAGSDPPVLAVLPMPWHQADLSGDAPVDVTVTAEAARGEGRREWPVRVSVVVRDNVLASVFGYLTAGDLPTANRIVESAVDLLYGKAQNALAAAGGAYVLVRSPLDPRRPPMWVPWLSNLRRWFPWLPDGAILDGWAHLRGIARPPDAEQAATAFVEALQRGLPFYSAGVRLLFEGFTRVEATVKADRRPPGFGQAFEIARRLALRVDVRQPFTVVRLG